MAGRYGMSFAKKFIEEGDYDAAVAAATEEIEGGNAGPEPLFDRATAHELNERYAEAVLDYESAASANARTQDVDPFVLDDAYFTAVLASARAQATTDLAAALRSLDRYRELQPKGAHVAESLDWKRRLRGELPSLLDKTKRVDQA